MKTIRGKLLAYFFVFVVLFQITAISIFISSNELTNKYDDSFQRFLLLNSVSQKSDELYDMTKIYIIEPDDENLRNYYNKKAELFTEKENLANQFDLEETLTIKNYINLV